MNITFIRGSIIKIDIKLTIIILLVACIALLIGLNLGKNNSSANSTSVPSQTPADDGKLAQSYKEKVVTKVIRDNAKDLQVCYLDLLTKKPVITESEMELLFKVEEDGKISSAKITQNGFHDEPFAACVIKKMESYYLSPPPLGINRYISHTLAFKSEATAAKDAKERAEKNRPPKMLPVH